MGLLFGSILQFIIAVFGITFGLVGLLVGIFFSTIKFILAGPLLIIMVVIGLIFWQPLLWLVVLIGIFYLFRIKRNKRYIKIQRK